MFNDNLISKIRDGINNGFSIGMSGRDRMALSDLANLEAKMNPAFAQQVLGQAADDIGFGMRRGNKSTLSALMSLGNGVEGFESGGMIPGPVDIDSGDDTVIAAKRGEYVIPEEVVRFIGLDKINKMVEQAKVKMGEPNPQEHMAPKGGGYATGGLIPEDPTKPLTLASLANTQQDNMARMQPTMGPYEGVEMPGSIGATINDGSTNRPVYDANTSLARVGKPMTPEQSSTLANAWQKANPVELDKGVNNITVSAGGRVGTYQDMPNLKAAALQDRLDAENSRFGMNPYTGTINDPQPLNVQSIANLRGSLNRTDANENINVLRNEMNFKMNEDRMRNALEVAKMKGDYGLQAALIKALRDGTSGRGTAYNTVSDDDAAIIEKGIAEGRIDPTRINSRTARIYAQMERKGGGTTNYVGASGNVKYQNSQGNLNSRALAEGVAPLYDSLLEAGSKIGNTRIMGVNKIRNWAKEQTGDPNIVAFNNLRDDVIAESERVLLGSGVLSDSKYLRAVKNVNSAQSYPQLEAAVKQLKTVVGARLEALNAKPFQNKVGGNPATSAKPSGPKLSAKAKSVGDRY